VLQRVYLGSVVVATACLRFGAYGSRRLRKLRKGALRKALAVYKPPPHQKKMSGWERGADSALGRGLREAGPCFFGGRAALLGLSACSEAPPPKKNEECISTAVYIKRVQTAVYINSSVPWYIKRVQTAVYINSSAYQACANSSV
jgi:hypothetical protein